MRKLLGGALASALLALSAHAQVLTFEGINAGPTFVSPGNFYNGGAGPNVGVTFFGGSTVMGVTASSLAPCNGGASVALQPSGCNVMFFNTGEPVGINRAAGFTTGFSLFYSAPLRSALATVWSGLNGTGTLLATLLLPSTGNGAFNPACSERAFCPWTPAGVTFAGTAQSILFASAEAAETVVYVDNVTLGSATPAAPDTVVPEPSTSALMLTGLAGLAITRRRRALRAQRN